MFLLHFFSRILTHHQACLLFCLFFTSRLVAPVVRSAVSVRRQKTRTSCHCTESRLRPVALHDSQIETDAQNKNVSLFCVQPAMTNLLYDGTVCYHGNCGYQWQQHSTDSLTHCFGDVARAAQE